MKFENSASLRKKKTLKILNVTKNWKDPSIKQILFFGSILVICFTEINIYLYLMYCMQSNEMIAMSDSVIAIAAWRNLAIFWL